MYEYLYYKLAYSSFVFLSCVVHISFCNDHLFGRSSCRCGCSF